jgi:hypothetical protein
MPGVWLARSLARKRKKRTSVVTTGSPKTIRHLPRNGFNGFLRARPGDRAFLSPSPARCEKHRRQLDASVETSGPHDFAVRGPHRSSPVWPASIASRTHVRDDRETPLSVAWDGRIHKSDLPDVTSDGGCVTLARRANQGVRAFWMSRKGHPTAMRRRDKAGDFARKAEAGNPSRSNDARRNGISAAQFRTSFALRAPRNGGYLPLKWGLRFSMKACRPSRKSSESMQAVAIALIAPMSRSSLSFKA